MVRSSIREKPTLVTAGTKQFTSTGLWNQSVLADYVQEHGDKWIQIGKLASVAYHQNTPTSKKRARRKLAGLFITLMSRGVLIVREYGKRGEATAVKLFEPTLDSDIQSLDFTLDRMKKRKEISDDVYNKARQLARINVTAARS